MHKVFLLFTVLAVFTFNACKKETEAPINMGKNFFPLEKGKYQVYKVDSIVWDDFNQSVDTFHLFVKTTIDTNYFDASLGTQVYVIKKYSSSDGLQFNYIQTMKAVSTSDRLELTVQDLKYIKLIFPLTSGSKWNSNAYNVLETTETLATDVDYPLTIAQQNFDSCANILIMNDVNLIEEKYFEETYAREVGLIYSKQVEKRQYTMGLRGYSVIYQIQSHGVEQ